MKINLVTTPILDSFSSKSENLIVGKWCLQELENTKKKLKIKRKKNTSCAFKCKNNKKIL